MTIAEVLAVIDAAETMAATLDLTMFDAAARAANAVAEQHRRTIRDMEALAAPLIRQQTAIEEMMARTRAYGADREPDFRCVTPMPRATLAPEPELESKSIVRREVETQDRVLIVIISPPVIMARA